MFRPRPAAQKNKAGQSRFQSLIPMYIAEADVLLIVYLGPGGPGGPGRRKDVGQRQLFFFGGLPGLVNVYSLQTGTWSCIVDLPIKHVDFP